MCLIVDANVAGEFLAARTQITDWLLGSKGNPRLVAAGTLRQELARLNSVRRLLIQLDRAGRLRKVEDTALVEEEARLHGRACCRSNDVHVIALAILSGARTLATRDHQLAQDFRDKAVIESPRGSVYRYPRRHRHLLRHTPESCHVRE